jgi:hypothetical protein
LSQFYVGRFGSDLAAQIRPPKHLIMKNLNKVCHPSSLRTYEKMLSGGQGFTISLVHSFWVWVAVANKAIHITEALNSKEKASFNCSSSFFENYFLARLGTAQSIPRFPALSHLDVNIMLINIQSSFKAIK